MHSSGLSCVVLPAPVLQVGPEQQRGCEAADSAACCLHPP